MLKISFIAKFIVFLILFNITLNISEKGYFFINQNLKWYPEIKTPDNRGDLIRTSEYEYIVTKNRFDFRDEEWSDKEINAAGNILLLGSSFADGEGVERSAMWDINIERLFKKDKKDIQVFNAGRRGADITIAMQKYISLVSQTGVRAKYVLFTVFTEQLSPLSLQFDIEGLSTGNIDQNNEKPSIEPGINFTHELTLLKLLEGFIKSSPKLVDTILLVSNLTGYDFYSKRNEAQWICLDSGDQFEKKLRLSQKKFLELKKYFNDQGRDLLIAVVPSKVHCIHYERLNSGIYSLEKNIERIKQVFNEIGIPIMFLIEPIMRSGIDPGDLYYNIDGHFNEAGYDLTAKALYTFLDNYLNNCPHDLKNMN